MIHHKREAYNILQLLSEFGGLHRSIFGALGILGFFINTRLFIGKLIREMYFIKIREEKAHDGIDELEYHKLNNLTSYTKNL